MNRECATSFFLLLLTCGFVLSPPLYAVAVRKVKVAVVDTGVDPHNSLLSDTLFLPGTSETSLERFGRNFSCGEDNLRPFDDVGHGSHLVGILKKINPAVEILVVKYKGPRPCSNELDYYGELKAIEYAVRSQVDIILFASGGKVPDEKELELFKEAERRGILVVVAAGNNGENLDLEENDFFPASYNLSNMVRVMSTDDEGNPSFFSNYGKEGVDIALGGEKVRSFSLNGTLKSYSGTSQAAAKYVGEISLLLSFQKKWTAFDVKRLTRMAYYQRKEEEKEEKALFKKIEFLMKVVRIWNKLGQSTQIKWKKSFHFFR